jgi:hypothetical protein
MLNGTYFHFFGFLLQEILFYTCHKKCLNKSSRTPREPHRKPNKGQTLQNEVKANQVLRVEFLHTQQELESNSALARPDKEFVMVTARSRDGGSVIVFVGCRDRPPFPAHVVLSHTGRRMLHFTASL